jgi:hypothetical protein
MDSIKVICSLIICILIYITALLTVELIIKSSSFIKNDTSCKDVLLNLSNPFSYINKVTKPFLIELVNISCSRNRNINDKILFNTKLV